MTASFRPPRAGQLEQTQDHLWWWRLVAVVSQPCWLAIVLILLYRVLTVPVLLHTTEINPDGKVLWTGAPGSHTLNDIQILNTVQEWIIHCRSHPDDDVVAQLWRERCRNLTDKQAKRDIERYWARWEAEALKPEHAGNRMRVKVEKHFTRSKETANVYRLWWHETWVPLFGAEPKTIRMSGIVTVQLRTSSGKFGAFLTAGDIARSPTGLFVVDYIFNSQSEESL